MGTERLTRIKCATSLRALSAVLDDLSRTVLERSEELEKQRRDAQIRLLDYRAIVMAGRYAFEFSQISGFSDDRVCWEASRRFNVYTETVRLHLKRLRQREKLADREARKRAIIKMSRRRTRKFVAAHFGISPARVSQIIHEAAHGEHREAARPSASRRGRASKV